MSEPEEIRDRTAGEYVRLARADLEYAEIGASAGAEPVLIGFHAQQAVEKLLKAVLVTHRVDPGDTHDLGRLLERARLLDRALADALGSVGRLTPYAVFHRYPPRAAGSSPRVTRDQVRHDLDLARAACALLERAVDQRLQLLRREVKGQGGDREESRE